MLFRGGWRFFCRMMDNEVISYDSICEKYDMYTVYYNIYYADVCFPFFSDVELEL